MSKIFSTHFDTAVSLGVDCRVRYQISLSRYKRLYNGVATTLDFERALYASNREVQPEGTFPFDWWITPFASLLKCIETDFKNLFEFDSLEITPSGSVRDKEYGITFPHAFTRKEGKVTPEILCAEYDFQHMKFRYLTDKFRKLQSLSGSNLYVVCGATIEQVRKLRNLFSKSQQVAHVLCVQFVDQTVGVTYEEDGITIYQMSRINRKPSIAQWQGDDENWGSLFEKIKFH